MPWDALVLPIDSAVIAPVGSPGPGTTGTTGGGSMTTHFLVHNKADTVGVIVTEGVAAGETLTGWVMETDETVHLTAQDPVPLGHKMALGSIKAGDTIVKYGNDVGRAVADIGGGHHVHVHNMKTKRW